MARDAKREISIQFDAKFCVKFRRNYAREHTKPTVSVRLAQAQKAKYIRLGGAPWLRRMIDAAGE